MTIHTLGKGKCVRWLKAHADYTGDDCLTWPFNTVDGYGTFRYFHETNYAHRFMCQLVHGEPPTPKHQAAHECGRGHLGCVNPRHIVWKTHGENQKDRRKHGTTAGSNRIPPEVVAQIKALKGKMLQREIAAKFNIRRCTVSNIQRGHSHAA